MGEEEGCVSVGIRILCNKSHIVHIYVIILKVHRYEHIPTNIGLYIITATSGNNQLNLIKRKFMKIIVKGFLKGLN